MWKPKHPRRKAGPPPTPPDPALWVRTRLGFPLDPAQANVVNSTARRVLVNSCRQWGKSTVAAAKAVYTARHQPDTVVLVVSPTMRQSAETLRKAALFLLRIHEIPRTDRINPISLQLANRSRIIGLAGDPSKICGFSGVSLLLIDEAARVRDELYYDLRATVALSGSLWLLSTPFYNRGIFHQLWTTSDPEWTRFAIPATECPRITAEMLEQERRHLGRAFDQAYLCQFRPDGDLVFEPEVIERAFRDDIEPLVLD